MADKKCKFNKLWLDAKLFPEFGGWIDLVVSDATLAFCKVCHKSFTLSSMGFDRGEMIPPVPAPRYKRKLNTNEDSKQTSNKQNTRMSEQTTNIMPPPRRKNKYNTSQEINRLPCKLDGHGSIAFLKEIEKDDRVKNVLNKDIATDNSEFSCHKLTVDNEKNILEKPFDSSPVVSSDLKNCNKEFELENRLELDRTFNVVHSVSSNDSEIPPVFGETKKSNIFEKFLDDRVLAVPLGSNDERRSTFVEEKLPEQVIDLNEGRDGVRRYSLPENSATIVGVFYKPEYSLLCKTNGDKFENPAINNGPDSTLGESSSTDDGNRVAASVISIYECKKINNKTATKDSEEVDSGVYFSDSKSPPHERCRIGNTNEQMKEKCETADPESDLEVKPFSCNDGDTFDNKSSEDLGTQNYRNMLDSFEAQTVNAFREEITSRFALNGGQINKNKVVEVWLDSGEYLSKKKNSSFSEYLRTMLETGSSVGSLSPYSLSAVDEDERSDSLSDYLEGPKKDEIVDRTPVVEACAVPSHLTNTYEIRTLDPSNNLGFVVGINNVNKQIVNTDCTEVTPTEKNFTTMHNPFKNLVESDQLSEKNCYGKEAFIDSDCSNKSQNMFDELTVLNTTVDSNPFEEPSHRFVSSPSIPHGAVDSLITYFETIQKQEVLEVSSDDISNDHEVVEADVPLDIEGEEFNGGVETSSNSLYHDENEKVMNSILTNCESKVTLKDQIEVDDLKSKDTADVIVDSDLPRNELKLPPCLLKSLNDSAEHEVAFNYKSVYDINDLAAEEQDLSENKLESKSSGIINEEVDKESEIYNSSLPINTDHEWFIQEELENDKNTTTIEADQEFNQSFIEAPVKDELCDNLHKEGKLFEKGSFISDDACMKKVVELEQIESETEHVEISEIYSPPKEFMGTGDELTTTSFKPTRIPVVILTETDMRSSPIGLIELHPMESSFQNQNYSSIAPKVFDEVSNENIESPVYHDDSVEAIGESDLKNAIDVVLEKNWGSVGLKIKGDGHGVVISDILVGGAADNSGLVFKGWIDIKALTEEVEIFC